MRLAPAPYAALLAALVGLPWTVAGADDAPSPAAPRVGLAEEFDSVEGWAPEDPDSPLKALQAVDGRAVLTTFVGSFGGAKPDDQPRAVSATTSILKDYDPPIDLDRYRYIVMKTDEKPMYAVVLLRLDGKEKHEVHVAHTSGLLAQDLASLGIGGKGRLRLEVEVMNTGRQMKIDYIRLVSELTDAEQAVLIPPPVRLYKEGIGTHPYQRLEALNARAARPLRWPLPEEKVVFHDVGTRALTWRMTADPADQGFSEQYALWRPDGSGFFLHPNCTPYYSFAKGGFDKTPPNPLEQAYRVRGYAGPDRKSAEFQRWNAAGGVWEVIHTGPDGASAVAGDVMVVKARDKLLVVRGDEADPARRVREFTVPFPDSKGHGLTSDGRHFTYFGPWGTYQKIVVDTATGAVTRGSQFTFTHGMHGSPLSLMSYATKAKLLVPDETYLGEAAPGPKLRLYGPYADAVTTDYGIMTSDGRYGLCNGTGGELKAQHVMFDAADAGTVLRLATYNVSKITWSIWTKITPSPDYTKLMYISDMLGNGDFFMAVIRSPDAPVEPAARRTEAGVALSWKAPARRREIAGYHVYRSSQSGRDFVPLTERPVPALEYLDAAAPSGPLYYLVAAVEHSGLEGYTGPELAVEGTGPRRLHLEAEAGARQAPLREVFDGMASGYRAVRVSPVRSGESRGVLALSAPAGTYHVWARCRRYAGAGAFAVGTQGPDASAAAALKVDAPDWAWVRGTAPVALAQGGSLSLASADEGLAIDKIILTDDEAFRPGSGDDRFAPPPPPADLQAADVTASAVTLRWAAPAHKDHAYTSVYTGRTADFALGNETVLGSTLQPSAVDWALPPASTRYYKVVAVNRRGQVSAPATIEVRTAAMDVFTRELPADTKAPGPGLSVGTDREIRYVAAAAGQSGELTLPFDTPADGTYYLWAQYGARTARGTKLSLKVDGADWGVWNSREPHRMGQDLDPTIGPVRWFVDRVCPSVRNRPADSLALKAGAHTLSMALSEPSPWIAALWVTNDPSFVPPGFSAQVRFNTDRRQK